LTKPALTSRRTVVGYWAISAYTGPKGQNYFDVEER
jgi:hypothetical protein